MLIGVTYLSRSTTFNFRRLLESSKIYSKEVMQLRHWSFGSGICMVAVQATLKDHRGLLTNQAIVLTSADHGGCSFDRSRQHRCLVLKDMLNLKPKEL